MNKRLLPFLGLLINAEALALNLQSFRPTDSYRYSLLEDSYQEKFKGDYVLSAGLGFTNSPFYVSDRGVTKLENEIINHQYALALGGSWYVNRELVLGADVNAVHSEVFQRSQTGIADSALRARYNLHRSENFSFAVVPKLYLPTGRTDDFTTVNSLAGSLSGVGEYRRDRWHFLASLGVFHGSNNQVGIVDYRNLVLTTFGASFDLTASWTLNAEAIKNFTTNRDYRQDEGDYYLTARHKLNEQSVLYLGAGIAGLDEIDRNNYTVFTGVKFHL